MKGTGLRGKWPRWDGAGTKVALPRAGRGFTETSGSTTALHRESWTGLLGTEVDASVVCRAPAPEGEGAGPRGPRCSSQPWPRSSPLPSPAAAAGGAVHAPLLATWPNGSLASGHPPPSTEAPSAAPSAPAGARLLPAVGRLPCDLPWQWPRHHDMAPLRPSFLQGLAGDCSPSSQSSYVPLAWFMSRAVPSGGGGWPTCALVTWE